MTAWLVQLRAGEVGRDGNAGHLAQVDLLLEAAERLVRGMADAVGPSRIARFECEHVAPWREDLEATIAASVTSVEIASFEAVMVVEQAGRTVASGKARVVPKADPSSAAVFSAAALTSLESMLTAEEA